MSVSRTYTTVVLSIRGVPGQTSPSFVLGRWEHKSKQKAHLNRFRSFHTARGRPVSCHNLNFCRDQLQKTLLETAPGASTGVWSRGLHVRGEIFPRFACVGRENKQPKAGLCSPPCRPNICSSAETWISLQSAPRRCSACHDESFRQM